MVSLFKKEHNSKKIFISESDKYELSKKAYDLGFEVGYHKHSKIGWVSEKFSYLDKFACEHGLDNFVQAHYSRGSEDGIKSKEHDIYLGLSKKGIAREDEHIKFSKESMIVQKKSEPVFDSGFKSTNKNEHNYSPTQQPAMMDVPHVTSVTKSIDRPTLVDGFKPLKPRR